MAVVDFSSVGSFQVYPTGTYKMRVDGWERNKSSNKGTPQIRFKCSIADGPYAGKPYTEFINITNASAWKAGSFIVGCGVHSSEKIDTESRTFEKMCEACVGRTVYISLTKDDQYNNNKSNSYQEDEEQEPLEFKLGADDAPSFVKGEEVQW